MNHKSTHGCYPHQDTARTLGEEGPLLTKGQKKTTLGIYRYPLHETKASVWAFRL